MIENQEKYYCGFISYVESLRDCEKSEMLSTRIIPSFLLSMRRNSDGKVTAGAVENWVVDMLLAHLKPSTAKRYLGGMRALYRAWSGDAEAADIIFSSEIPDNYTISDSGARLADAERNLHRVSNLLKVSGSVECHGYIANRIFQYLLFNPCASVSDVIDLQFKDACGINPHTDDIILSMRKAPQAKYVFPLQQGKRRRHAIVKDIVSDLHGVGRRAGMSFGTSFSRESISEMWIAAAIKAGISLPEIVAVVKPLPALYSFLSAIKVEKLTDEARNKIINRVADSISDKTPGWFVARMRSGVSPEDITDRLKALDSPLFRQLQSFYPLRCEQKMEKKKKVTVKVPVLPGILFFKLPYDKVTPFMAQVGDLAWCFRNSTRHDSAYSVIPNEEMIIFQRTVGSYTGDIEMELVSSLPELSVGDEVLIEDDSVLRGQKATIRKIRSVDGTFTYTLRLSDTAFIRWKDVNYSATHITKI